MEKRTSGAEALVAVGSYGTAKAMPFVQGARTSTAYFSRTLYKSGYLNQGPSRYSTGTNKMLTGVGTLTTCPDGFNWPLF